MTTTTTADARRAELADTLAALRAEGYSARAVNPEAARADRNACAFAHCDECGTLGLNFHGLRHEGRASYIAFASCFACGYFVEF